jgi:hypothetical protein
MFSSWYIDKKFLAYHLYICKRDFGFVAFNSIGECGIWYVSILEILYFILDSEAWLFIGKLIFFLFCKMNSMENEF